MGKNRLDGAATYRLGKLLEEHMTRADGCGFYNGGHSDESIAALASTPEHPVTEHNVRGLRIAMFGGFPKKELEPEPGTELLNVLSDSISAIDERMANIAARLKEDVSSLGEAVERIRKRLEALERRSHLDDGAWMLGIETRLDALEAQKQAVVPRGVIAADKDNLMSGAANYITRGEARDLPNHLDMPK